MVVLNPIICGNCNNELQPEDIMVGVSEVNGKLVRRCSFCGDEVEIE